jgi:signal transduction histidine kinase/CheY-like chemotaxis protein
MVDNRSLSKKIDTLSLIIETKKLEIDTSVVTTQKKTITTYVHDTVPAPQKNERSFIGKLFSKKKNVQPEETTRVKVQEELSVSVDTLAVAKQNKALDEVEKIMHELENDQRTQNRRLLHQELELIHANSLFINQLLNILHDVEREELAIMKQKSDHASTLVNESTLRISILLLAFFLGAALLVYRIWIDITKSNYYKEQLEKARDEAEELSQIKQRFLANMSHEIRTPLQSIIGFAEQIRHQPELAPEAVEAIHSSSEHLLHIVNEVLDYSRISSGHFTLAHENFRLIAVIREIEAAIHIQADRKNLTLLLDQEQAGDYTLQGDSFRLRQVLYNLLGNAVKFTSKGYVKLTVKTEETTNNAVTCTFEITDTGIGIQAEDLKKIFNQFEQANTLIARQYGGTGLGLTIVKSLVEAQSGTLNVDSQVGHGSVFTVVIPFAKATTETVTQHNDETPEDMPVFDGKVIVVDDDAMILRLASLILKKHHVEHIIYREAEKLLNQQPDPQVTHILMDIRMPHINGVELCHALRKTYDPAVKFVALTAHVFPQERQALIDEGFDIVLTKPFHERQLISLLGITPFIHVQAGVPETPATLDPMPDFTTLRQMTLGDESLFISVLNQFQDETTADLEKLGEKIRSMEAGPIREIVHKLAGRIGQIGMAGLSAELRGIEDKLVQGVKPETLLPQLTDTRNEIYKLLETVRAMTVEQSVRE